MRVARGAFVNTPSHRSSTPKPEPVNHATLSLKRHTTQLNHLIDNTHAYTTYRIKCAACSESVQRRETGMARFVNDLYSDGWRNLTGQIDEATV